MRSRTQCRIAIARSVLAALLPIALSVPAFAQPVPGFPSGNPGNSYYPASPGRNAVGSAYGDSGAETPWQRRSPPYENRRGGPKLWRRSELAPRCGRCARSPSHDGRRRLLADLGTSSGQIRGLSEHLGLSAFSGVGDVTQPAQSPMERCRPERRKLAAPAGAGAIWRSRCNATRRQHRFFGSASVADQPPAIRQGCRRRSSGCVSAP
jgi:hypothetical protein